MTDRSLTDRRQGDAPPAPDRRHGDRRTYRQGCRCVSCRAANAKAEADRVAKHRKGLVLLGARVPAAETWDLIRRRLKPECLPQTYGAVALLLGYGYPMLQFGRALITERTRRRVLRLARQRLALNTELPPAA